MLRGLRKASSNLLGKAIMAAVVLFLVASFAIWGIGDIFRGFGVTTVAKIGRTEITVDQFRQLYNDRLQQLGRQVGRPISSDQARLAGIDQQLLQQLIAEAALDDRARQLRLVVPDSQVVKVITEDPAFRGPAGNFDQQRFLYMIRQAGYTEQRFVAEQRRLMVRRQIASAVSGSIEPPKAAADALNRFENEQRSIEYVVLDKSKAGEIPAPTEEELAKYFDDRKVMFRAPEYRKIVLLTVSAEEIARWTEISEADAKQAYEAQQSRYSVPERREVQQIVFQNPEEAQQGAEKLAAGTTFQALAAERKLTDKDIDLGLVAKSDILDPAVAAAAFALKSGENSAPVKGRFGTVLVHVGKIESGHVTPFEEAEPDVKRDLALERGRAEVNTRRDKVEDELAAGSRLDEVAQKLAMPVTTIAAVDRSGRGPDGQPVAELPKGVDVLTPAFSTQVGVENDPLQVPGGFIWYEAAGTTPSRERSLDEVKETVAARWRDDQIVSRLDAKATEITDKLKAGTTLADIAAADGLKLETAQGLKRRGSNPLPAKLIAEVFGTAKGEVGRGDGQQATDRVVFRVTDITVPPLTAGSPEAKQLTDTLRGAYGDEMLAQYVSRLQSDMGATINQAALAAATGGRPLDLPFDQQ